MVTSFFIIVAIAALTVVGLITAIAKRYKRCPSDKLLVVFGRTGKNADGGNATAKIIHGGGAFVWPIIQDYIFLDLKPIGIDIDLRGALSKQNIRVNVPSTFTIAVSSDPMGRANATEKLLGLTHKQIEHIARDIIFGQLRSVIATMDLEEINANRDKFIKEIQGAVEPELFKIGLKLINVNITDITDEANYIKSLGQEAAAEAINDAKKSVAEKNRDGQIGVAAAEQEQTIAVAQAKSAADIGSADADQKRRTAVAKADALAVEGENKSAILIAQSTALKNKAKAEADKISVSAANVNRAEAAALSYQAQETAAKAEAEMKQQKLIADVIVPQEIKKQEIEIAAEAEANRIKKIASGEYDAVFMKAKAIADGHKAELEAQAQGFIDLIKAAGTSDAAVKLMVTEKIEELTKLSVSALNNIKIDKTIVWSGGNGNGNGGAIGNHVKDLLSTVAPYQDILKQVGVEMPAFLQGKNHAAGNENNTKQLNS